MWCYLQVKLCDPCLSAFSVPPWPKKRCINTLPFLSFLSGTKVPNVKERCRGGQLNNVSACVCGGNDAVRVDNWPMWWSVGSAAAAVRSRAVHRRHQLESHVFRVLHGSHLPRPADTRRCTHVHGVPRSVLVRLFTLGRFCRATRLCIARGRCC